MEKIEVGSLTWKAEYVDKGVEKAAKRIEREAEKARKAVERLQRERDREERRAARDAERNTFLKRAKREFGGRGPIKDFGDLLKGGGIVAGITFAADAIGDMAEKIGELNAQFARGKMTTAQYWGEILRGVPVLGTMTTMFDRIWAAMDGSAEALAELEEQNKRDNAEWERRIGILNDVRDATWELVAADEGLRNRFKRIGLKDEALEDQKDREERDAMFSKNQDAIEEFERRIKTIKDPLKVKELTEELALFKQWASANLATLRDIQEREKRQRMNEATAKKAIAAIKGNFEAADKDAEKRKKEVDAFRKMQSEFEAERAKNVVENMRSQVDVAFEKARKKVGFDVQSDPLAVQRSIQGAINKNKAEKIALDQLEVQKAMRAMLSQALTIMNNPLAAAFAP